MKPAASEIRWLVRTEGRSIPKYTYEFLCEQTGNPLSYERTNGELRWYRGLIDRPL